LIEKLEGRLYAIIGSNTKSASNRIPFIFVLYDLFQTILLNLIHESHSPSPVGLGDVV
jgi:hypothetical protein